MYVARISIAAIILIIMIGVTNVTGCKPKEKESKYDQQVTGGHNHANPRLF
jgi:uncharacterized lipoprotein YehR (DUF1307 family)